MMAPYGESCGGPPLTPARPATETEGLGGGSSSKEQTTLLSRMHGAIKRLVDASDRIGTGEMKAVSDIPKQEPSASEPSGERESAAIGQSNEGSVGMARIRLEQVVVPRNRATPPPEVDSSAKLMEDCEREVVFLANLLNINEVGRRKLLEAYRKGSKYDDQESGDHRKACRFLGLELRDVVAESIEMFVNGHPDLKPKQKPPVRAGLRARARKIILAAQNDNQIMQGLADRLMAMNN